MVKGKIIAMNLYLGYITLYGVEENLLHIFSHIYFTDCRSRDESKAANWCFVSPSAIVSFPVRLMNDWMIDSPA